MSSSTGQSENESRFQYNRRRFLALSGVAGGALTLGPQTTVATDDLGSADLQDFDCAAQQFECGQTATAADGMVSSEDPRASAAGAMVLADGGNAIDAAITVQYVLNVVSPQGSGIGGGGFMVIYDADADEVTCVNSRERAPEDATPDMFLDNGQPRDFDEAIQRSEAIGVPGTLDGLETAREEFGTQSRERLLRPAIELARNGFTVDEFLAETIKDNQFKFNDAARDVFLDDEGNAPSAGDTLTNEDLAETFELLEESGREAFYEGAIAEDIAATVAGLDGGPGIDEDDLAEYAVTIDDPIRKETYDFEITGQPVPTSGPTTVAMITKILEELEVEEFDIRAPEKYHLLAEATRVAWADRDQYMGDPEFVDVPVEGLLADDYLSERAGLIDLDSVVAAYTEGEQAPPGTPAGVSGQRSTNPATVTAPTGATAHFTTVDQDGNVVSYTSTIEQFMGSGKMVPGRGFLLNNELTDFDFQPGGPNEVEPRKRPLSSMSPTIVFQEDQPVFTAGSPGGFTIITNTQQAILHRMVYGLAPLESITEPDIFTARTFSVSWEDGVPGSAIEFGEERGQPWSETSSGNLGNIQVLAIDDEYTGAADPTRNGQAVGVNLEEDPPTDDQTPGFGIVAGLAGLTGVAYLTRKMANNSDE